MWCTTSILILLNIIPQNPVLEDLYNNLYGLCEPRDCIQVAIVHKGRHIADCPIESRILHTC